MSELFSKRLPAILAAGAICVFAAVLISQADEFGSARLGGPIVVRAVPSADAPADRAARQPRSVVDIHPAGARNNEAADATDRH